MTWDKSVMTLLDFEPAAHDTVAVVIEARSDGTSGWRAEMRTSTGRSAIFAVNACSEGILRLRMTRGGATVERASPMLAPDAALTTSPLTIEESGDRYVLRTPRLRLTVTKEPWSILLQDTSGRELLRSDNNDKSAFGGGHVSPPWGFVDGEPASRVIATMAAAADESFYGLGERFKPLDHRGHLLPCFNWGSGTWKQGSHKSIPFFMSTRGYGLFLNSTRPALFDMAHRSNAAFSIACADDMLDLFIIHGPGFKEILSGYTTLTGRPKLPPSWSLGIWMSRATYESQAEVEQIADRLRGESIPCDVIKLDTGWFHRAGRGSIMDHDMEWGEGFPAPRAMADRLHAKGFRLCLWVNTWFLTDSPKARQAREFGYLLHKADGSEHTWDMGSRCMVVQVDLTHAPAREWFKDQLKGLLDDGADTFFCDWGVDSPVDLNYKTTDGLSYSNAHSLEFLSAAHEAIKEHTGAPGITWSLCGYGGVQRYPASYAGDSRCTFRDLANVLRGGLSGSMSGVGLWGAEIGGFGRSDTGGPDAELYVRYLQHGFLLPFAEFHGIGPREPWHYGEEVAALYRRYAQLRYRLLPYLYAQMHHACDTGIPVLRPMMLEFPDDFNTRHLDLQYMLGDALLVAPIVDRSTRRPVYLPPGTWFDFWTDRAITGGAWIDYDAPLDRLPLFVRGGHALLVGPGGQNAAEAFAAPPEIHLYGDAEATALASDGSTCQRVTITNTDGCLSLPGPDRTYVLHGVGPIKHLRAGEASCKVPAAAPVFADVGVKANAVTILVSGDAAALVEFE